MKENITKNDKRKKYIKRIAAAVLCLIVVASALCCATGVYVYNASIHAVNQERRPLACKAETLGRAGFDVDAFEARYVVEEVKIRSTFDGHTIPANYLSTDGSKERKTVILAHGLNGNRLTGYPVAEMFLRNGYNILTYDQRDSGESTAGYMTCGYWESKDLADCVEYVKERCGGNPIGAWGSSIGGATVGFYLGTPEAQRDLSFAILDCPVSDMAEIIDFFLTRKQSWIPKGFKLAMGDIATYIKLGYRYDDCNVCDYVRDTTVPVLIFHTENDNITPYHMGSDLYDAMENNVKEIVSVSDSGHTDIYFDHPQMYEEKMMSFIERTKKAER